MTSARAAAFLLTALLVLLAALLGGARGLAYAGLYAVALLPGLPVGRLLFGRNPAGTLAGTVIGYGVTALAIWVPVAAHAASAITIGASWTAVTVLIWLGVPRPAAPIVALPAWTPRTTAALCGVMLLAPALCAGPYLHIGQRDAEGNKRYRAYFTADFVWHEALAAELSRFAYPPRNPYMASRPLSYYWAYYLLPATATHAMDREPIIESFLAINALGTAGLFVGMIFVACWAALPRPRVAATAVALTVLAASAEGLYSAIDLMRRGRSLAALKYLNIDAVTSWPPFGGLSVDGLQRSMWYNPQHSLACALGLIALTAAAREGSGMSWRAALGAGLALGLALIVSPFPGGAMTLIYAVALLWDAASRLTARGPGRGTPLALLTQAAAVVPVALAFVWDVFNRTFEGAGGAIELGLSTGARRSLGWILLLALGPVLVPSVAGVVLTAVRRHAGPLRPAIAGLLVSLGLMFGVTLVLEPIWIGWRAGQVLLVTIPPLIAVTIAALRDRAGRTVAAALVILLLVIGLPTTLIDAYNAQDTSNTEMGPGFRWTVVITPGEQQALQWIERSTPPDAVVQMSLNPRGRETWTLIPSFARRRMAAGLPISLLRTPEYEERAARADRIFASGDPDEASRIARQLRIDYLYVGRVEREAFAGTLAALDARPDLFARAFQNHDAVVYAVK
jgi:hypothetical protein